MQETLALLKLLALLPLVGSARPVSPTADEAAIREVDSQMMSALNARDLERWLSYLADNATIMPPNEPAVVGRVAIRKLSSGLLALPSFAVAHQPGTLEVSRSGDLAYITYSYEFVVKDSQGKPVTEKGKDVSIYKKVDGSWKLLIDMWSPNSGGATGTTTG